MKHLLLPLAVASLIIAAPAVAQQPVDVYASAIAPDATNASSELISENTDAALDAHAALMRLRNLRAAVPKASGLLVTRLSADLGSRDATHRQQTLRDIILYSGEYGDLVDLGSLSPQLLRIFANDRLPAHRIMAAHAIALIGNRDVNQQLFTLATQDSDPQVRRMALYAAASALLPAMIPE